MIAEWMESICIGFLSKLLMPQAKSKKVDRGIKS